MKRSLFIPNHFLIGSLAAWVLLCTGCRTEVPLNVYLITMDTTRADHLGCYGHADIQTPNIDRFAKEGTRFENAYTVVPITLPSHLSIMSGTYPIYHGVRENAGFYVPDELETLAEILSKRHYDTAAFVGAYPLDSQTGIDQGFDLYDDYYPSRQETGRHPRLSVFYDERPASEVALKAMTWLENRTRKPFFLWTHFFDPHQPWTPPSPFRERYPQAPYDAEIASVDAAIGQIMTKIEEKGMADRTLIVLTADHGEGLGEHGETTHALLLYSSTLRVPLIVKDPRKPGGTVVDTPVATIDIFPTILDRLGFPIPEENQGVILPGSNEAGDPDREILSETLFGRLIYGWSPLKRLTAGHRVLIHGPSDRLYDRRSDPRELTDLVASDPRTHQRLGERYRQLENEHKAGALERIEVSVSQEDMERLAALGYVGSGMTANEGFSDAIDPDRRDPLTSMKIFDLQNEARTLAESGNHELAISLLERAYAVDPDNPLVIQGLANSHLTIGNLEVGLVHMERLLKLAPKQTMTYVLLAKYHRERDQLDEAATLLKQAVDLEPADLATRMLLAYALEDAGRPDAAEAAYREILALDEHHVPASNGLATLLYRKGDSTHAIELFEEVLKKRPYYAPAYLNLAVVALDRGDHRRALALGKRALALRADYPQAKELLKRIHAGTNGSVTP